MLTAFVIDPNLLLEARNLCAGLGKSNPEYVRGVAELVIMASPGLTDLPGADVGLIEFLTTPEVDPDAPISDDLRRALFAAYGDAFHDTTDEGRYSVTRLVLHLGSEDYVSWTARSEFAITNGEAVKVLDALRALV